MSRSKSKRTKSRRRKGALHTVRGLFMEGLGVAVLVFLYLAIQHSPSEKMMDSNQTMEVTAVNSTDDPEALRFTGHYASSWTEYTRKTRLQQLSPVSAPDRNP